MKTESDDSIETAKQTGKVEKIRAFVAIHPDARTLAALQHLLRELQRHIPSKSFRWARDEQLHLTLQFLAYVERARVIDFERALGAVCGRIGAFGLRAKGLGCFPSCKRPRVLWVGLDGAIETLQRLKGELDDAFVPLGYVPEERDFHPHITLARINEPKNREIEQLGKLLVSYEAEVLGEWRVERVELMQSVLSPAGAKYTVLDSFPLSGPRD